MSKLFQYEVVSGLQDDICGLRATILYCQNQILRKEIAIAEVMSGAERKLEVLAPDAPASATPPTEANSSGPTVRMMIESVLPELNGSTFWYSDIKNRMLAQFPERADKIRRGIHPACQELFKRGTLLKVPGGLQVKH